jgi:hypothetical protein
MKRIVALLKETWWLWILFFGSCTYLTLYIEPFMVVTLPMLVAIFVYFAFVRFDENGDAKEIDLH